VCDESQTELQRVSRNHYVECADRRPLRYERGGHLSEAICGLVIKGHHRNVAHEGLDQAAQAAGTPPLGQRNRAHAQL